MTIVKWSMALLVAFALAACGGENDGSGAGGSGGTGGTGGTGGSGGTGGAGGTGGSGGTGGDASARPATLEFVADGIDLYDGSSTTPVVRILDEAGEPLDRLPPGLELSWSSDDDSIASVTSSGAITGNRPGTTAVRVALAPLAASLEVRVRQLPTELVLVSGGSQSGPPWEPLLEPVVVRLEDRHGDGVPGIPLWFTASDGAHHTGGTVATDEGGLAHLPWTLAGPGEQTLTITSAFTPDLVVTALATVGEGRFVQVTAGYAHTCAVQASGVAWCWGSGERGALGTAVEGPQPLPVQVGGGHRFVQLAAGYDFTCARDDEDRAWCWGLQEGGRLGNGSSDHAIVATPVEVAGGHRFVAIAAGYDHACGVDESGAAWCWGSNGAGQLGVEPTAWNDRRGTPQRVAGEHAFGHVSLGQHHSCGVDREGAAWCWGSRHRLGNAAITADSHEPVAVAGERRWTHLAAAAEHTCGYEFDRPVFCWGQGPGIGGEQHESLTPVLAAPGGVGLATGSGGHSCVVDNLDTYQMSCWGSNWTGQLGVGAHLASSPAPVAVEGGVGFFGFAAGWDHTCGLEAFGTGVRCWGANSRGQLGDGTDETRWVPTAVRFPQD